MNKLLIVLFVGVFILIAIFNVSGNTSSTEGVIELTKTSDNMAKINSALDVVGEGAFANALIETAGFKGVVEQAPSSASVAVTEYKIRDGVTLKYTPTEVTGVADMYNNNLPPSARGAKGQTKFECKGLVPTGLTGIQPVIKSDSYNDWTDKFMFSDQGLALNRLDKYSGVWTGLEGTSNAAKRKEFLEWILGNVATPTWNSFKTDRLVTLRQINVEALTGLDKNNKTISAIIDPNRAYLYEVHYINTNSFKKVVGGMPASISATDKNMFVYDLANHINQTIGKRTLIIPNNDDSQLIDTDGNPIFLLN